MNQSNKGCICKDCQAKYGMPDELKAKLAKILRSVDPDHYADDGVNYGPDYWEEYITEIEQAYKDAGYASPDELDELGNAIRDLADSQDKLRRTVDALGDSIKGLE